MNLKDYFIPVDLTAISDQPAFSRGSWGAHIAHSLQISSNNPLTDYQIAIIGLNDERNTPNKGCKKAANSIRKQLYNLAAPIFNNKIIDLGDLIKGKSITDTYFALAYVCTYLKENNITPILIGADQDHTFAVAKGLLHNQNALDIVSVDSKIDWDTDSDSLSAHSHLSETYKKHKDRIWEITVLGHQTYLTKQHDFQSYYDNYFEDIRLGELRGSMQKAEPVFRNADIASFDISAVRFCDSPGHFSANPNGLHAEEYCQLARYAGLSNKLSAILFSGLNPKFDDRNISAQLTAQAIWCFIDGLQHRVKDYPATSLSDYKRYSVVIEDVDHPLVFYKSMHSELWWIEISWLDKQKSPIIIACSEEEYQTACQNEVPEIWWKNYKKQK